MRWFRILGVIVLALLAVGLAGAIFQAGFLAGASADGSVPAYVGPYGWHGWGWGFGGGLFGILGFLLFLFLFFAILRAVFGGWGRGPRGGWGGGRPGGGCQSRATPMETAATKPRRRPGTNGSAPGGMRSVRVCSVWAPHGPAGAGSPALLAGADGDVPPPPTFPANPGGRPLAPP